MAHQSAKPARRVVIHLFGSLEPGGAEVRTLELFQHLQRSGGAFDQVVFQSGLQGRLTQDFAASGARVITERFRSVTFWRRLLHQLHASETAALHIHVKRGNARSAVLLPVARMLGTPVRIAHFRSDGTHLAGGRFRGVAERVYLRLIDLFATDIVGVSPASLERGWRTDWERDARCRVVLSGVPLDGLQAVRPRGVLQGALRLPAHTPVIVHVGRSIPLKNRRRAIEVLAALPRHCNRRLPHLAFVGRTDVDAEREQAGLAAGLGLQERVHSLGHRSDVPQLMADASLLLLTSTQEGLPGVMIEALSVGTPVVASELPGTQFVAGAVQGVSLVDLGESNEVWGRTILHSMAAGDDGARDRLRDAVRRSPFDVANAAETMADLWSGGASTASRPGRGSAPRLHASPPDVGPS